MIAVVRIELHALRPGRQAGDELVSLVHPNDSFEIREVFGSFRINRVRARVKPQCYRIASADTIPVWFIKFTLFKKFIAQKYYPLVCERHGNDVFINEEAEPGHRVRLLEQWLRKWIGCALELFEIPPDFQPLLLDAFRRNRLAVLLDQHVAIEFETPSSAPFSERRGINFEDLGMFISAIPRLLAPCLPRLVRVVPQLPARFLDLFHTYFATFT